ncbi:MULTISPECIES: hypothetical protein [unclassified Ruegeria]|uniref:hypothetical protein n=1 Tax=unclassified Ruegeria TaxID=2625375 RepID=UPI001487683A|nr:MULTISPECIES: hypothetical protein [unclassified Ruegeria]NOD63303.1 hypothetical protein [Ruegeria sp. HKCCD6109]NOD75445.1 hypothetical protein [Ruegeria sp. HKCCD4332]NOD91525.1 hypothetical protein [Ruegeria sp. HKCCD4884]
MSRTLILIIVLAAIGVGGYYYLNQPEPTPAERLQSAAEDASDALADAATAAQDAASDAVDAATEQASEAASSLTEQASEAASSVADQASEAAQQASDQVAALTGQGQELLNSWIAEGKLNPANFDYDGIMTSLEESTLAADLKEQAIKIVNDIKASPETIAQKIQELTNLLTQQ